MISDSSCIILLSRTNSLGLLKKLYPKITVPSAVKNEVLIEEKQGFIAIQEAIDKKWIRVKDPKQIRDFGLGDGESACLSLALELKDTIILDDAYAIKVANTVSIEYIRTTSLLFMALQKKIITKKQAISLLNRLIESGYYLAPEHYAAILAKLSE